MVTAHASAVIRLATVADVPRIVELGSRSLMEGPYHDILMDNPGVTSELAKKLLTAPNARVLVAEEDGVIVGLFAFIVFDHYYSGESVAGEMVWYTTPEARRGGPALELLWAAEKMAHDLGAKKMQLTAPTDEIAEAYQKLRGYKRIEVSFQRDISNRG